jgi:hypothetical protein
MRVGGDGGLTGCLFFFCIRPLRVVLRNDFLRVLWMSGYYVSTGFLAVLDVGRVLNPQYYHISTPNVTVGLLVLHHIPRRLLVGSGIPQKQLLNRYCTFAGRFKEKTHTQFTVYHSPGPCTLRSGIHVSLALSATLLL